MNCKYCNWKGSKSELNENFDGSDAWLSCPDCERELITLDDDSLRNEELDLSNLLDKSDYCERKFIKERFEVVA